MSLLGGIELYHGFLQMTIRHQITISQKTAPQILHGGITLGATSAVGSSQMTTIRQPNPMSPKIIKTILTMSNLGGTKSGLLSLESFELQHE